MWFFSKKKLGGWYIGLNKKWHPTKGKDKKNNLLLLLLHSILMSDSSYFSFPNTRPFFSLSTHPVTNHDHKHGSPIQDGLNFVPYHFSHGDWFGMGYHRQVIQISSLQMKYRSQEKGTDSSQWCCYEGMLAASVCLIAIFPMKKPAGNTVLTLKKPWIMFISVEFSQLHEPISAPFLLNPQKIMNAYFSIVFPII